MEKRTWLAGLAAVALVGATLNAYADDDKAPMGGDDQASMHDGMDGGMMAGGWGGRLKEKLGLSDDQATKLKDFFKKQKEENTPLRDQMKIDMDTLHQKVDMKASDSEVKRLLDKLSADRKDMQAAREKMVDQLREMLTPTQQAKLLFMKERGRRMMGQWKGKGDWKKDGKGHKGSKSSKSKDPNTDPSAAPADSGN